MKKILDFGSFYFADPGSDWDVSSRVEERVRRDKGEPGSFAEETGGGMRTEGKTPQDELSRNWKEDRRFVWNEYLLSSLREFREGLNDEDEREEFDSCGFLVSTDDGGWWATMVGCTCSASLTFCFCRAILRSPSSKASQPQRPSARLGTSRLPSPSSRDSVGGELERVSTQEV